MTPLAALSARLEALNGRLMLFAPICLAGGIGWYFSLSREPGSALWIGLVAAMLMLIALASGLRRGGQAGFSFAVAGLALVIAGMLLAGLRTELTRAPVLGFRYYGAVEGRVIRIDRSASEAIRLTLDQVRLDRVAMEKRPVHVRISLLGDQGFVTPAPGQRLAMTAFLGPPEGPVEPGGFDFRRMAWYDRLGAVGYTRAPVLLISPAPDGTELAITRLRGRIAARVRGMMPGEAGAFAAAITTGDRSAIGAATLADLRGANLAHLLAISGLHMGLLAGFVFAALRAMLALVPGLADRAPIRKFAAIAALLAGGFYLALSGGNVATLRAYIMISVMFGAVLIDRRALTLRAVALAALIILTLQPEALTEPGFQMSFAATTALVAVFAGLRDWRHWQPPRWARRILTVVISSAVAGLATAPFAAAHFNQISHYGLIANVLAVPVMGAMVMPLAVLAALLAPIGASWLPLWLMRFPILWILGVADWVSGLDGALGHAISPGPWVLPLIAGGGLMLALFLGRARLIGLVPLALGFALWSMATRPPLLVSASGGLVGVIGPEGRALSKPRGDSFTAQVWLENDGDTAMQKEAAARLGLSGEAGRRRAWIGDALVISLTGRGARDNVAPACAEADLVILSMKAESVPDGCRLYDETGLIETGALAIWPDDKTESGQGLRIETVADHAGDRPWTR
ncbi:MAG: ComEC/Rec2 family competence protein [Maritimibacter sp.]